MRPPIALALALALAGSGLAAQTIDGGLYTGLALPLGDLKDRQDLGTNQFFGAHVGGFMDFYLTPRHEVRGHVTLQSLPGSGWGGLRNYKNDYTNLQVGADWVYHFQNPRFGWYVLAGASINSIRNDWKGYGTSGSWSQSGKLGVRGGGGYAFSRRFALEGTLNQVSVDAGGANGFDFDTATWAQASVVFRF